MVEGFRWASLGTDPISIGAALISTAMVIVLLVSGAYYFRRAEAQFTDVV